MIFIHQNHIFRWTRVLIAMIFLLSAVTSPSFVQAQTVFSLPVPGSMITLSSEFIPTLVKGLKIYPDDPLRFDFIVEPGQDQLKGQEFQDESMKMIKYFLASLTVPKTDMWVNLSPAEPDRIIPKSFGETGMGRDLLAQDYVLKQLTASLIYPEGETGKKFWDEVYAQAQHKFGTTDIPLNTFNKVWIVPDKAEIYETDNYAFVVGRHLKVMLEEDYMASQAKSLKPTRSLEESNKEHRLNKEVLQKIIIPKIEQEVNEGKTFANLRQVYNAMILATWFKKNLQDSLLGQVYINQNKIKGIDLEDKQIKEKIYDQYMQAFKQGVYNYIKEDYDPVKQEVVNRKYISGGVVAVDEVILAEFTDRSQLENRVEELPTDGAMSVSVNMAEIPKETQADEAMYKKYVQANYDSAMAGEKAKEYILKILRDKRLVLSAAAITTLIGSVLIMRNNKVPDKEIQKQLIAEIDTHVMASTLLPPAKSSTKSNVTKNATALPKIISTPQPSAAPDSMDEEQVQKTEPSELEYQEKILPEYKNVLEQILNSDVHDKYVPRWDSMSQSDTMLKELEQKIKDLELKENFSPLEMSGLTVRRDLVLLFKAWHEEVVDLDSDGIEHFDLDVEFVESLLEKLNEYMRILSDARIFFSSEHLFVKAWGAFGQLILLEYMEDPSTDQGSFTFDLWRGVRLAGQEQLRVDDLLLLSDLGTKDNLDFADPVRQFDYALKYINYVFTHDNKVEVDELLYSTKNNSPIIGSKSSVDEYRYNAHRYRFEELYPINPTAAEEVYQQIESKGLWGEGVVAEERKAGFQTIRDAYKSAVSPTSSVFSPASIKEIADINRQLAFGSINGQIKENMAEDEVWQFAGRGFFPERVDPLSDQASVRRGLLNDFLRALYNVYVSKAFDQKGKKKLTVDDLPTPEKFMETFPTGARGFYYSTGIVNGRKVFTFMGFSNPSSSLTAALEWDKERERLILMNVRYDEIWKDVNQAMLARNEIDTSLGNGKAAIKTKPKENALTLFKGNMKRNEPIMIGSLRTEFAQMTKSFSELMRKVDDVVNSYPFGSVDEIIETRINQEPTIDGLLSILKTNDMWGYRSGLAKYVKSFLGDLILSRIKGGKVNNLREFLRSYAPLLDFLGAKARENGYVFELFRENAGEIIWTYTVGPVVSVQYAISEESTHQHKKFILGIGDAIPRLHQVDQAEAWRLGPNIETAYVYYRGVNSEYNPSEFFDEDSDGEESWADIYFYQLNSHEFGHLFILLKDLKEKGANGVKATERLKQYYKKFQLETELSDDDLAFVLWESSVLFYEMKATETGPHKPFEMLKNSLFSMFYLNEEDGTLLGRVYWLYSVLLELSSQKMEISIRERLFKMTQDVHTIFTQHKEKDRLKEQLNDIYKFLKESVTGEQLRLANEAAYQNLMGEPIASGFKRSESGKEALIAWSQEVTATEWGRNMRFPLLETAAEEGVNEEPYPSPEEGATESNAAMKSIADPQLSKNNAYAAVLKRIVENEYVTTEAQKRQRALNTHARKLQNKLKRKEFFGRMGVKIVVTPRGSSLFGYASAKSDLEYEINVVSGLEDKGLILNEEIKEALFLALGDTIEQKENIGSEDSYFSLVNNFSRLTRGNFTLKRIKDLESFLDELSVLFLPAAYVGDRANLEEARKNSLVLISQHKDAETLWKRVQEAFLNNFMIDEGSIPEKPHLREWLKKQGLDPDKKTIDEINDEMETRYSLPLLEEMLKVYSISREEINSAQLSDFGINKKESEPVGGIDFNPDLLNLQIKRDSKGIPLPVSQQPIKMMKIDGFIPVIINIQPITNLPFILGFNPKTNEDVSSDKKDPAKDPELISSL